MSLRPPWIAGLAAVAGLLLALPASASLVLALDTATMVSQADHIAVVDVASVKMAWDDNHQRILSTIDLSVVEAWKGSLAPATHVKVVQPGGTVGDMQMVVFGMTRFAQGERALVFLRGGPEAAMVVGMAQGKRPMIVEKATGRWMVQAPDRAGASFIRPGSKASTPITSVPVLDMRVRPLDDVRTEIRDLVAKAKTQ
jgi:hypothetical protein